MEGKSLLSRPAEDAVKLFVGQVPRAWGEEELRAVMAEAGEVHELNVVRDRDTKESRGCAFVMYMTRAETDNAIKLLHGNRILPGSRNPMQVKYADGHQVKAENKLFVGMLPKSVTAEQLTPIFSEYGTVVELNVLKGANANKGSAFVKFEQYSQAAAAMNALNGKYHLEGCIHPMVVKWADTDKEKEHRRVQKQAAAAAAATAAQHGVGFGGLNGLSGSAFLGQGHGPGNPYGFPGAPAMPGFPGSFPYSHLDPATAAAAASAPAHFASSFYAAPPYTSPFASSLPHAYPTPGQEEAGAAPGAGPDVLGVQGVPNTSASAVAAAIREKLVQKEGPPGSNLFVYNIPSEWRDEDLLTAFGEFGNVLSTRVFMDKLTGQSKNFGFVCYQNAEAATAALAVMDGFMVGGKRLKVALKKGAPGTGAVLGSVGIPALGMGAPDIAGAGYGAGALAGAQPPMGHFS